MDKSVNPAVQKFRQSRWEHINRRTINGRVPRWWCKQARFYLEKGIRLEMTKAEFYAWCASQAKIILKIYANGETPSIDRIDSNGHYIISNLRILTMKANVARRNAAAREAVNLIISNLPTKFCLQCGVKLHRKIKNRERRESLAHFKKRVNCSKKCAYKLRIKKHKTYDIKETQHEKRTTQVS